MKKFKNSINNFFSWLSKTELVELDTVDVSEDPKLVLLSSFCGFVLNWFLMKNSDAGSKSNVMGSLSPTEEVILIVNRPGPEDLTMAPAARTFSSPNGVEPESITAEAEQ